MTWRSAHGKARRLGALVVVETCPANELPAASPSTTVQAQRDSAGRFLRGNRIATGKRLRPGIRGTLDALKPDPAFVVFLRWARRYSAARRAELARAHGGELSCGVGSLIESASLALAASRFVAARGAERADPAMLAQSARLSEQAKQLELSAWELASREAKARADQQGDAPAWQAVVEAFGADDEQPQRIAPHAGVAPEATP